jgi:hypothetical protein
MRFEVNPHAEDQSWRKVKSVHLDGELLTGCLGADDGIGWVRELVPDPDKPGYFMHDGVEFLTRERRGKVVITMRDTSRDWDADRKGGAKVQVGRAENGDILVQVYSIVRPGAIKQMRLELSHLPAGIEAQAQKAGLVAGRAAEMLGEQFGDSVDPSDAARVALGLATEMLLAEQGGRTNLILDQQAG